MTRQELLQSLITDRFNGNQSEFARAIHRSQSQVHQWISGHRVIGDAGARHIELSLNLNQGYFDNSPKGRIARSKFDQENQSHVPVKIHGMVPLISRVQAGEWMEAADEFMPGDAEQWLPCPAPHSSKTFALRVQGISMEPKYHDGDIVFVDPDLPALHGKNVVVRLNTTNEVTLKGLVIEGEKMFLKALNPDWPGPKFIDVTGDATICGVVIGKWVFE